MAERYESQILGSLHEIFSRQQQIVQSSFALRSQIGKSYTKKDWLNQTINWQQQNDTMQQALQPILLALLIETGYDAMHQVDQPPTKFDTNDAALTGYAAHRAAKIATDVNAETEKQLRATLSQGQEDDETDEQLQARIGIVFGAALTYRSDRIARTETTRAQGFGDVTAWEQSGVVSAKEWYTIEDERTCVFCNAQDGRIVELDADFYHVGDTVEAAGRSLPVGYDDVGEPPLHVSCRCTLIPTVVSLSDLGLD